RADDGGGAFRELAGISRRRGVRLEERARPLMGLQQRLDLLAQALIARASLFEIGRSLAGRRNLKGLGEEGLGPRELCGDLRPSILLAIGPRPNARTEAATAHEKWKKSRGGRLTGPLDDPEQPRPGKGPVALGRGGRDAEHRGAVCQRQAREIAQLDQL